MTATAPTRPTAAPAPALAAALELPSGIRLPALPLAATGFPALAGVAWAAAQPDRTGSSAPSLTSVSASSAAGSESRTTPTPA